MPVYSTAELAFLEAVSAITYGNPFLPELIEKERTALGRQYVAEPSFWSLEVDDPAKRRVNAWRIVAKIDELTVQTRRRIARGATANDHELRLYEDAALYSLYHQFYDRLVEASSSPPSRIRFYGDFLQAFHNRMRSPDIPLSSEHDPQHTFACFHQIVRAFQHIFASIIGASGPAGRLRAAVWQSIFTHDMRRYRRTFYRRMGEFVTLVTGPSGSGKELVARAIALSRYIPFDGQTQVFRHDSTNLFHPIHIGALTSTLIESELFGHRKGAFTGAVQDRRGWLDECPPAGAVFLDEIGELALDIQVKLLRVIETRAFTPVGGTSVRKFEGKLIAATNRDLPEMIESGGFREDLYYRLCSDLLVTPSLHDQARDTPGVLRDLVRFMAMRNAEGEADVVAGEAYAWIERNLGLDYAWPGNYRELEQFLRNFIVRQEYRPAGASPRSGDIFTAARTGRITADELLRRYCTLVYSQTRSYEETARTLKIDRRTVKSRIDRKLLDELQMG